MSVHLLPRKIATHNRNKFVKNICKLVGSVDTSRVAVRSFGYSVALSRKWLEASR